MRVKWILYSAVFVLTAGRVASRDLYWSGDLEDGSGDLPLNQLLDDLDEDEEGSGQWDFLPAENKDAKHQLPDYDVKMETIEPNSSYDDGLDGEEWYDYYDPPFDTEDYDGAAVGGDDKDDAEKIQPVTEAGETDSDIEIKPRPDDEEVIVLETSQILIMVGSAFVSFAIFMLTFFMCRRAMAIKAAKAAAGNPYTITRPEKESSIVKDYQKVPTSTLEILQQETAIRHHHLANPTMEPLVK